ncbi:MAG TPA: hypothetical protein VKU85_16095, partial [bacterium]|nr:hypothetical protein [bacterium]
NYTVTISVSNGNVSVDHPTEDVNSGDTITFLSPDQETYVVFDAGQWPFTETEPADRTITVPTGATGSGAYTVADDPETVDNYEVRLTASGAKKASGQVDIAPDL